MAKEIDRVRDRTRGGKTGNRERRKERECVKREGIRDRRQEKERER